MHWKKLGLFCSAAAYGTTMAIVSNGSDVVTGAYIIEFTDDFDTNSLIQTFESAGVAVRRTLGYKLFKGVSIQLDNETDVDTAVSNIADVAKVKNTWPVRKYPLPNDTIIWTGGDSNVATKVLNKRQSTNGSDAFSPHVMTQVNRLHAEGVTGKGTKIAVVDTGVDYTHPALGGCFGPGCLVSYGTSFVDDDNGVLDCLGHGTHVSGIIAAQKNEFGFTGAAPDATLGAYKVAGCDGIIRSDDLIAAFNQAYEDGSDIITCSIGYTNGWSDGPESALLHRIVEAGVPCTVAAGNEGATGAFFASAPADGEGVAAIASTENNEIDEFLYESSYTAENSSVITFGYLPGVPSNWGNISLPLWTDPYNVSDPSTGCNPLPSDTPDLSDHLVLIVLSNDCFPETKIVDAVAYGARYIMLYYDYHTTLSISSNADIEALATVPYKQGLEWKGLLSRNVSVTVDITEPTDATSFLSTRPNPRGGFISPFSTWGPGNRAELKPQFSTPGSHILSTYPLDQGGFAVASGTSMSTPLAAAIYALVGQVRGTLDPATIENVLTATAKPNLFHDGKVSHPFLAPTAQQGAGLIQAYDAAYSTTSLSVSRLLFNDTDYLVTSTEFTIKNLGTTEKTYTLSNVGAATVYIMKKDDITTPDLFPNEMTTEYASLSFSSDKVTIPAGGEAIVTVAPTPPALDGSRLPVYSGYIAINATEADSLSLPYLGIVGSLGKVDTLDKHPGYGTMIQDGTGNAMVANHTFSFPKGECCGPYQYPFPIVRPSFPGLVQRVDIISLDPAENKVEAGGVQILGSMEGFPKYYASRAVIWLSVFYGKLGDETFVPEGGYKILIRQLRLYGDESKKEDYDSWESPPFFIKYIVE